MISQAARRHDAAARREASGCGGADLALASALERQMDQAWAAHP
jgi:hypothetical protein